jgi:NADH dehydrogenase
MTFVVVGGGPTGVELAGALAEIAFTTLKNDFKHVDTKRARILLVESGDAILTPYHPNLRQKALEQLKGLGVEVRFGKPVTDVDAHGVLLGDERIASRTVLWAAGVAASPLARCLGVPLDRAGRVVVAPDLSVPGNPDIFVIGDLAASKQEDGSWVPGVAPAAQQMGAFVAKQIRADLAGKPRGAFRYFDKGLMATVGRTKAVLQSGPLRVSGFLAWLLWVVVHIWSIVSLRNRLIVMVRWAWAWWGYRQAVRLIWHPSTAAAPAAGEDASSGAA